MLGNVNWNITWASGQTWLKKELFTNPMSQQFDSEAFSISISHQNHKTESNL